MSHVDVRYKCARVMMAYTYNKRCIYMIHVWWWCVYQPPIQLIIPTQSSCRIGGSHVDVGIVNWIQDGHILSWIGGWYIHHHHTCIWCIYRHHTYAMHTYMMYTPSHTYVMYPRRHPTHILYDKIRFRTRTLRTNPREGTTNKSHARTRQFGWRGCRHEPSQIHDVIVHIFCTHTLCM